jgi:ABC-type uncharacterized transport system permease subunit
MNLQSTPEFDVSNWLTRIEFYENAARLSAATAFGLSLVLAGLYLRRARQAADRERGQQSRAFLVPLARLSRLFFVLGMGLGCAHFALASATPSVTLATLMSLGIVTLLSTVVIAIDFDHDRLPLFTFLTSAISWLLLVLTPFVFSSGSGEVRGPLSLLGRFHILAAIAAESLFVLGFLTSLIYLFVHSRLRSKRLTGGGGLPSLDTLDRLVDRSTVLGLLIMTSSLVSGLGLTYQGYSLGSEGFFKLLWAFGVWVWYVIAIFGRARLGWKGPKGALASVIGAGLLGLALFGTIWS